ncbi:MAG TPA: hypothetical protein DCE41_03765 [Cytophagales bacterium]|nr:hypothetical protein [Cytophagales bacterium]HAA18923.1 hypothetical protein [Cytophagales bacterium]HAP62103.1 hypothetical protein [Cytophagales bacterium]
MKKGILLFALLGISLSTLAQEAEAPISTGFHEIGTTLWKLSPLSEGVLSQEVIGDGRFIRPFTRATNLQYKHVQNRTAFRASIGSVRSRASRFGGILDECNDCSSASGGYNGVAVSVGGEYRYQFGNAVVYPFLDITTQSGQEEVEYFEGFGGNTQELDNWLWSSALSPGVGAQYEVLPHLKVFGEVSVMGEYFFNRGSLTNNADEIITNLDNSGFKVHAIPTFGLGIRVEL